MRWVTYFKQLLFFADLEAQGYIMIKKLLLLSILLFSPLLHAEEPRAFYEFMYSEGTGVNADDNLSSYGIGARFTFPASDNFFLGFKGDITATNQEDNGVITHLAFSTDIRLFNDLYLTGDIGRAWGYTSRTENNVTYSEHSAQGRYHTAGLRYQFSDYVEVAVLYRNTLFTSLDTISTNRNEEILFSLNFAITEESLEFFHFLAHITDN